MKKIWCLIPALFVGFCGIGYAQSTAQTATTEISAAATPNTAKPNFHDEYDIPLTWNQATVNVLVNVVNTSDSVMRIAGVQSSSGVWVVDFPKQISAKSSAALSAIVEAKPNSQSEVELVRLKTADGEKTLMLKLNRTPLISFDSSRLQWAQGESMASKSVLVTVNNPAVSVKSVSTVGGHSAVVQRRDANSFLITVTPVSTAKAGAFPVLLTLNPAIPGVSPAITCAIVPSGK